MAIFLICFLISCAIVFFLSQFYLAQPEGKFFEESGQGFDPKLEVLENLKELETDFEMGKLSEAEFKLREQEYKNEFVALSKNRDSGSASG